MLVILSQHVFMATPQNIARNCGRIGVMEPEEIHSALLAMEKDTSLTTVGSYAANPILWPDHKITFVEKHINYLKAHSDVNPQHYLSNLRLMIKKRP